MWWCFTQALEPWYFLQRSCIYNFFKAAEGGWMSEVHWRLLIRQVIKPLEMPWIKTSWKLEEYYKEIWFMFDLFLLRHVGPAESQDRDSVPWSSSYSHFCVTKRKTNMHHDSRIKYIWFSCTALCCDFAVLRRVTCGFPCSTEWAQQASQAASTQGLFCLLCKRVWFTYDIVQSTQQGTNGPLSHSRAVWIMLSLRTNGINWVNWEFFNW